MDDLLVWGSNEEEHDRRLAEVQKRVLQYGLLLNHYKCVNEVEHYIIFR